MTATATPLYFGPQNLFGWYHSPDKIPRSVGVVIVSPNGYDMVSMHWGWRCLAERLSTKGFPAVRFDLHGTGDSPGDDQQPDRVNAWLASINEAIEFLKQQSGVSQVVLLGTRLGGTLASIITTSRNDVVGLILYSPCVNGRQYVREVKVLAAAIRVHGDDAPEVYGPNDVVMAGWLLTEQTVNELSKLDASKLFYQGKHVLYIHRNDIGADQKLLSALQDAKATVRKSSEFLMFSQDALVALEPVADFNYMCDWLEGLSVVSAEVPDQPNKKNNFSSKMRENDFVEEAICFGDQKSLFGVLCLPEANLEAPVVIFISTAANHHIGTHRTTVELARKLADNGIGSLRMDVAGVGDSPVLPGRAANQIYFLPAVDDVIAAIDVITEHGTHDIALTGTCSGAYLAYNAACKDPRVGVLAFVNLSRFIWRDTDRLPTELNASTESLGTYVRKALSKKAWKRLVSGEVDLAFIIPAVIAKIKRKLSSKLLQLKNRFTGRNNMPNQVEIDCFNILERGSRIDMIYSDSDGGMDEVALYLGARGQKLVGKSGFGFHEISGADHTFTTKASRKALLDTYIECVRKYEASKLTA